MKTRLPHHRRYNWTFIWRSVRPICAWLALLVLIVLVLFGMQMMAEEHLARLDAENAHATTKLEAYRVANFGAPGYVYTDLVEGTVDIEVSKL